MKPKGRKRISFTGIELANENEDTKDEVIRSASIVIDVNTGAIVSMVSLPDFNPNQFIDGISNQDFEQLNRVQAFNNFAIQGLYPPGSVFKVVSYWLAENEGLFPEGLNSRRGRVDCKEVYHLDLMMVLNKFIKTGKKTVMEE